MLTVYRTRCTVGRPQRQRSASSSIDVRTTCHPGYQISQRKRKLVEQVYGWMKTVGGLRKLRHRGEARVDRIVTLLPRHQLSPLSRDAFKQLTESGEIANYPPRTPEEALLRLVWTAGIQPGIL